jgi:hypothetical protein
MPAPIDEVIKRRVVQQWLSGCPRDKIASDNDIGEGTVSSIVTNYKIGLETSEFDSARELSIELRKQGLNWSDLASHFRLYNYFRKSGAAEEEVESFIAKVSSSDLHPEKCIELVNQLYEISREESVSPDQLPGYIKEKVEEKQRIDEGIQQADAILQSKNVSIEAINEHIQLNQKLNEHGLSMHDIDKLLNLLVNAKDYGFDAKKIVGKLRKMKRLEKKEKGLENNCTILTKHLQKYKEIIPIAELIQSIHIGRSELISFKIAVNESAETYGLTPSAAALRVINVVSDYNKKGQLEHELRELNLQKYAISQFCLSRSQTIMALMNLKNHGISEEQIISMNNFLKNNEYTANSYASTK